MDRPCHADGRIAFLSPQLRCRQRLPPRVRDPDRRDFRAIQAPAVIMMVCQCAKEPFGFNVAAEDG
jgi:hypothetical protein